MTETAETQRPRGKKRLALVLAGGFAGVVVGLAGIYGIARLTGNAAVAPECRPAQETAQRIAPLVRGEVAALAVAKAPKRLPELAFLDESGANKTLSDWRGRTVLFNLWATWCVPCRQEMPALDKLQATLGASDFEVVAINVDTRSPEKPKTWLAENGIRHLAYYSEPTGKLLQVLQRSGHVIGLPTTVLVDAAGCEIALLKGPAEWAGDEAIALVRAALGRPT